MSIYTPGLMNKFANCLKKQEDVKKLFANAKDSVAIYQIIIELGRKLPPFPEEEKKEENRVLGCQSILYLHSTIHSGRITFKAHSEALISTGLAYLLLYAYNDELPEVILKCPPTYLEELGIPDALTPSRSNGLASLFLRMKQEALKSLLPSNK